MDLYSRSAAVALLSTALAERKHYVLTAPPGAAAHVAPRLTHLTWTAYLDQGTEEIAAVTQVAAVVAAELLTEVSAVILVPIRPGVAEYLTAALGVAVAPDRDILAIATPDGRAAWPRLMVDALDRVDPVAAAQIRAAAV